MSGREDAPLTSRSSERLLSRAVLHNRLSAGVAQLYVRQISTYMWPFRKKNTSPVVAADRYQANPINLFFEDLILDILGRLPAERSVAIEKMNLQKVFSTRASEWKDVIRETLRFSVTFDVAVWDLWIQNRNQYSDSADGDRRFAQNFTDMYMSEGSKIDVWPEGALNAAKARIGSFRNSA